MRLARADFKCKKCGEIIEDVFLDEADKLQCKCKSKDITRIYGFDKYKEFEVGYYENFEHKPIYIESREQFKRECKKRNLERVY